MNLMTSAVSTWDFPNMDYSRKLTIVRKDKHTFLLLSHGLLLAVKRNEDQSIKLTRVDQLWKNKTLELMGAVFYKRELFLFGHNDGTDYSIVLKSIPGLFEKISVVPLNSDASNIVPLIVPLSW